MRRREYFWSLFHVPRKKQMDDLRTDQVEAIYEALPDSDRKQWRVWRESFQSWKELTEFPLFIEQLRKGQPPPVEVPPAPVEKISQFDERKPDKSDKTVELELERTRVQKEQTGPSRYVNKVAVKVKLDNQILQTTTTNISMKGLELAIPLPKKVPRYFQVDLTLHKKTIPILCSAVAEEEREVTRTLRIEANEYEELLRTWLVSMGEPE
jgi:hypothetical protein